MHFGGLRQPIFRVLGIDGYGELYNNWRRNQGCLSFAKDPAPVRQQNFFFYQSPNYSVQPIFIIFCWKEKEQITDYTRFLLLSKASSASFHLNFFHGDQTGSKIRSAMKSQPATKILQEFNPSPTLQKKRISVYEGPRPKAEPRRGILD